MKDLTIMKNYRQPQVFYFFSLVIPWAIWFWVAHLSHRYPEQHMIVAGVGSLLGLIAPLVIAMVLILNEEKLRKDFIGRLLNWRSVSSSYLIIAVLLMPTSILVAQLISLFFGYGPEQFEFREGYSFSSGILPVWLILLLAPVVEELAWHSYGTDCLRNRMSLLKTSLLFAFFWGIWHLPLSYIKNYYHSNLVESGIIYSINFFLSLFPFVLIMNWLYYQANRNILIPILFHLCAGFFNEIFATHPMSKVIQTGLLILLSIVLINNDKTFFLKH